MKKNISFLVFVLIVLSCPLFARPKSSKPMYISVEEIEAKEKPSFFGGKSDTFYYGDVVKVTDEKGSWLKVESKDSGKEGWVKDSVLTSRKIVSKNRISVDASEIALAGKGFSSPIEAEYSESYGIKFDEVDDIESIYVSPDEVKAFIEDGNLKGEE